MDENILKHQNWENKTFQELYIQPTKFEDTWFKFTVFLA